MKSFFSQLVAKSTVFVAGMLFLLLQEMNASTLLCGLSVVAWCYLVEGLVC